MQADTIVIGAGTVGSAVAHGLASRSQDIDALDAGDLRSARANLGLVRVLRLHRTVPANTPHQVRPPVGLLTAGEQAALAQPGTAP